MVSFRIDFNHLWKRLVGVCLFFPLIISMLSGCAGSNSVCTETTIQVNSNGSIRSTIIEGFDKDYYNSDELKRTIEQEIARYQAISGSTKCVRLVGFTVNSNNIDVVIDYDSAENYAKFNNVDFYYGTLSDVIDNGIDSSITLISTETKKKKSLSAFSDNPNIIIFSEPVVVRSVSDMLYVSANVELINENQARMSSDSAGLAYIILK